MTAANLLTWYNAIFSVPLAVSALLLILSSIRLGGHHHGARGGLRAHAGSSGGHGHAAPSGHAGQAHGHGATLRHHVGGMTAARGGAMRNGSSGSRNGSGKADGRDSAVPVDVAHPAVAWRAALGDLFGIGRAPLILVLELFFVAYGVFGLLASGVWMRGAHPLAIAIVPALVVAILGGAIFARVSAALITKIMPEDVTNALSREGLFGLTGTVTYPVTATGGRIYIYDEFGTLHDEGCRSARTGQQIAKGHKARVVDVGTDGRLIVEEA